MSARVAITWRPREIPLAPVAAWAMGPAARRLVERLLTLDDSGLRSFSGVFASELIVIAGASLPWVDGIGYLGIDPVAPSLRLPTGLIASVPASIFEDAVLRKVGRDRAPIAVLPDRFVPLVDALPISRTVLERLRA